METLAISEDQWINFFDEFSRDHAGWLTTIEVLDHQTGPQKIAENAPLEGISFDTKGSRSCSIEMSAGDRVNSHMTHIVDMPLFIRQACEPSGAIDIQIESARGPATLIHLRNPAN